MFSYLCGMVFVHRNYNRDFKKYVLFGLVDKFEGLDLCGLERVN